MASHWKKSHEVRIERALCSAVLLACFTACDSKPAAPAPAGSAPTAPGAGIATVSAPSASAAAPALTVSVGATASAPAPSASVAATASAPAPSASAAAGPCPAGAKRYDEPRFCVVLPEKTLDISYEGDAKAGNIELEARGSVLRFSWGPVANLGDSSLKEALERVQAGEELAGSGDLPGGAWSDIKKVDGDHKDKHVIQSTIKTQKLFINCNYAVEDAQAEAARAVCKSVRAY